MRIRYNDLRFLHVSLYAGTWISDPWDSTWGAAFYCTCCKIGVGERMALYADGKIARQKLFLIACSVHGARTHGARTLGCRTCVWEPVAPQEGANKVAPGCLANGPTGSLNLAT